MRWIKNVQIGLAALGSALLVTACAEQNSSTTEPSVVEAEQPVSVSLQVGEAEPTGRYQGTFSDVDNVTLQVNDNSTGNSIDNISLTQNGNIWSAEVPNLQIGNSYNFIAEADDSSGALLFSGSEMGKLITAGNNFLTLRLVPEPVGGYEALDIPRITRIYYSDMTPNSTQTLRFEVEASVGDNITYTVTADNGSVSSPSGEFEVLTRYSSFSVEYEAPNDNNTTVNLSVQVTNSLNYTIASSFAVNVSNVVEIEPNVVFNPVVLSIEGERLTDNVSWTAVVNDDGQASSLSATFTYTDATGSPSSPATSNPTGDNVTFEAELPYTASENGTLSLNITSLAGDNITVNWAISEQQFPNVVAINALSGGLERVATGRAHSCAVIDNGTTMSVGDNNSLSGGDNGTIYCWGENEAGQLGNGLTDNSSFPVLVDAVTFEGRIESVTAGDNFTCGLDDNGTIACWGDAPTISGSGDVLQVSAGGQSLCLLLDNSSVSCGGVLSDLPVDVASAVQVSVGGSEGNDLGCAVYDNGSVSCWDNGTAPHSANTGYASISSAVQVSVGGNHACAVLADGTAYCWGDNTVGQLGLNTSGGSSSGIVVNLSEVAYISAGARHTCAVRTNGTMRCWGERESGKIGNNTDGLGDLDTLTFDDSPSLLGSGYTNASQIAAGDNHTCALLENDDNSTEVRCWGLGDGGRLGTGDNQTRLIP